MTTHLEWHNHAFINENNIVIDVAVFDEWAHNHQLLEDIKISIGAKEIVCCCTFGTTGVGEEWTGTEFRPICIFKGWVWDSIKKEWNPPIPMPNDGVSYYWNNETENWSESE
jgi:hypothetical protein